MADAARQTHDSQYDKTGPIAIVREEKRAYTPHASIMGVSILSYLLGNKNERELRKLRPLVHQINKHEQELQSRPDSYLREKTAQWQQRLHAFLPLDLPPRRVLKTAPADQLDACARTLQQRFDALRGDFSSLPKHVQPTFEGILEARKAFAAVEGKFAKLRERYLDDILPEAYAVVKNGARRLVGRTGSVRGQEVTWDMIHFDVQLLGGIALFKGFIAEMATGEGKTLVATLPVYLNALTGLGVHVVTVNDYLALRDSDWMGMLYSFLGLTVGCLEGQMPQHERKEQYRCDITYGTNAEFGFDYLRDNGLATSVDDQVQRGHYVALIDEVDSVLIDEARTPLIISGPATSGDETLYQQVKAPVEKLYKAQTLLCNELVAEAQRLLDAGDTREAGRLLFKVKLGQPRNRMFLRLMENPDLLRLVEKTTLRYHKGASKKPLADLKEELYFSVDLKERSAELMEKGREFLQPGDPQAFVIPDIAKKLAEPPREGETTQDQVRRVQQEVAHTAGVIHATEQMVKAYCLFEKDVEYVIRDGEVVIVDEHTGREMPGRRWSDGLHQAVTAKEDLELEEDNLTYATITIQNYFRMYSKLAGMTGTAETEAAEFHDIYKLDVLPIPTNKPSLRTDRNALIFKTRFDKYAAAISLIDRIHGSGQPILVGTASVEASEALSRMMKRIHIPHIVLNAKNHMSEAEIVSRAGHKGAVTVSTNMAGRGTDIKLGPGVAELGGLFVLGTEHYESRRIDRQLRGRAARQGDPGVTQFFISLEDELVRNFGDVDESGRILDKSLKDMKKSDIPTSSTLEKAQRQIEQRNARWRKRVLDFDDVMNRQREVLYGFRNSILRSDAPEEIIFSMIDEVLPGVIAEAYVSPETQIPSASALSAWLRRHIPLPLGLDESDVEGKSAEEAAALVIGRVKDTYRREIDGIDPEYIEQAQRLGMLDVIDNLWQIHISDMEELREGVNLRAQGQKDPLVEYKKDAYDLFERLMNDIHLGIIRNLYLHTLEAASWREQLRTLMK